MDIKQRGRSVQFDSLNTTFTSSLELVDGKISTTLTKILPIL